MLPVLKLLCCSWNGLRSWDTKAVFLMGYPCKSFSCPTSFATPAGASFPSSNVAGRSRIQKSRRAGRRKQWWLVDRQTGIAQASLPKEMRQTKASDALAEATEESYSRFPGQQCCDRQPLTTSLNKAQPALCDKPSPRPIPLLK